MANPHGSFIWYELLTNDHDAAKRFYDAVVGWDIEPQASNPMDYRMIRTGAGNAGGVMQINDEMRNNGARPTWLGYIGVDDVDATAAKAEEIGGKVLMPPADIPDVGRFAMLADRDGVPFYIMRGTSDEESHAFSTDAHGHVNWNELAAVDAQQAIEFYTDLFGWGLGEAMDMGPMGTYQMITVGGTTIGAIFPKPAPQPMPKWSFYFRVPSVGAAKAVVEANGGRVIHGPQEVPGGDFIIDAFDPQGASFALVGKP